MGQTMCSLATLQKSQTDMHRLVECIIGKFNTDTIMLIGITFFITGSLQKFTHS